MIPGIRSGTSTEWSDLNFGGFQRIDMMIVWVSAAIRKGRSVRKHEKKDSTDLVPILERCNIANE